MGRRLALIFFSFAALACESDPLYQQPIRPDSGVTPRDAGPVLPPDAGIDAGVEPPRDGGEPPPASEPVYIHTGDTLYSYDPALNATAMIGVFQIEGGQLEDMVDIAIDSEGRMFGGTRATGSQAETNRIYQIDPNTAVARYRFSYDDTLHGLTFLPDGRLVIAGERVSVVDPVSGAQLLEFPSANAYQTSGDIVGLPDGQLYWTVRGEPDASGAWGNDEVIRINPTTGVLTWLGKASTNRIYGLGYANGDLYGFSSAGLVVTINPTTGAVIRQAPLAGRWFGATTNPVRWE